MKFRNEKSFQQVIVKCINYFIRNNTHPTEIGSVLAIEAANVLLTYAPNAETAYALLLNALDDVASVKAKEALNVDKEGNELFDQLQQNAPTSNLLQ